MMCRVLEVAPSGHYEWVLQPISNRAQENARLLRLIRASFAASDGVYGAPRVFLDLREAGETCSTHRVARLMRQANLRALHGYRTRRWTVGTPSVLIPNLLERQFTATTPNVAWVTDITYIRTWRGWLYLVVYEPTPATRRFEKQASLRRVLSSTCMRGARAHRLGAFILSI